MIRLAACVAVAGFLFGCSGPSTSAPASLPSTVPDTDGAVEVAEAYVSSMVDGELEHANELRCPPLRVQDDLWTSWADQVADVADRLGEIRAIDGSVAREPDGSTVVRVELEPAGHVLRLNMSHDDTETWTVCGEEAEGADDVVATFRAPVRGIDLSSDHGDVTADLVIDGHREVDVSQLPADRHGVIGRVSRLYRSNDADVSVEVRVVSTQYKDAGAAAVDLLRVQEAVVGDVAVEALDIAGDADRGFRYLASGPTFIQPATIGPYWDVVMLLAGDLVVNITAGPIASRDDPSAVLAVAEQVRARLLDPPVLG